MTYSLCSFVATLVETVFLSVAAAPYQGMAGDLSQLGLAGGPSQSFAFVAGVEKAPDSISLLLASADRASVPRQTRHRVFHRALLGAATAYVAILAVALLILACARRLSRLSVEGGRVRSLAGGDGNEAAGACGGNAEGGEEEDKNYEEDRALQHAIIEQARENLQGFRQMVSTLAGLRSGHTFKAVTSATSVYILLLSDMGALGAFIDEELLPLRPLWLQVMKEAVESATKLETGWPAVGRSLALRNIHWMNGDLVNLLETLREKRKKGRFTVGGRRWTALHSLVRVQTVTLQIAYSYLYVLHPESGATRGPRREALARLAALSEIRRKMILASQSFAGYFGGFHSQGFARKRFGASCGQAARAANLPLKADDQIRYLCEHFGGDLDVQPQGAAAAERTPSPPGPAPSSEQTGPPQHPQGPPKQPPGPPRQPAWPSMQPPEPSKQPPWPSTQPPGPPSASGSGSQGPGPFGHLGARPRLYSEVAAGGQAGSGMSSREPSLGVPHGVQHPAEKPGGPKGAGPPFASPLSAQKKKPSGSASGLPPPVPQASVSGWDMGSHVHPLKGTDIMRSALEEVVASGKEGASSGLWEEAEGVPEGTHVHVDWLAEELEALALAEEEEFLAADGGEFGVVQPSAGSSLQASRATHVPSPPEGQALFPSSPWAAPRTPAEPHTPGPTPSLSSPANAFFGVPEGAPRPPIFRPPLPSLFAGPVRQILQRPRGPPPGPVRQILQRPRGPPPGPVRQILQRPQGPPPGVPQGLPQMSSIPRPPPPPGFTGPPKYGDLARQILQGLQGFARPSGPFPSTSEGPLYGPLLGAVEHPFTRGFFPPSPSIPFPPGPFPSQPIVGGPPHVSPSVLSVRGPVPPWSAPPSIWAPFPALFSTPFFSGPLPPSFSQPNVSGPSSLGLATPAVSGPPVSHPSSTQGGQSRISGPFRGTPLGEPAPSATSLLSCSVIMESGGKKLYQLRRSTLADQTREEEIFLHQAEEKYS
ncbi:hypothetical protein Esti_006098 [Eimeria stiedai]